jgi:SAM-dependent methyltransferase
LLHVLDEYRLPPGTVLEVGCGSGADAIALARRRWEVTAVDCSPIAVERARLRAEQHDALLRFVLSDIIEFAPAAGQFDLVYDAGLYHAIRQVRLDPYLDALWRVTKPGSYYFCLAGAAEDTAEEEEEEGPPRVTADDIHHELGRLFESIHLRPIQLEGLSRRVAGWSCLMRRPVTGRA